MPDALKPYRKLIVFLLYGLVMLVAKWADIDLGIHAGPLADALATALGAALLYYVPNDPLPEKTPAGTSADDGGP